jgi:uncharacterized iron-regulated membrane protein
VHEGQLFGWVNQALGLIAALGLVTLSISAFVMWRKRAPLGPLAGPLAGLLGAPPPIPDHKVGLGLAALIIGFGLFLPVLGMSILAIAAVERLVLSRIQGARVWLGLERPHHREAMGS